VHVVVERRAEAVQEGDGAEPWASGCGAAGVTRHACGSAQQPLTYTNFTVERTHDPTMEVSVEPSVHSLDGSRVLLNVDVFLRNAGKVAIMPRFSGGENDRDVGLEISIVEIEPAIQPEPQAKAQEEMPAKAGQDPTVPWFDWTSGDGRVRKRPPSGIASGLLRNRTASYS